MGPPVVLMTTSGEVGRVGCSGGTRRQDATGAQFPWTCGDGTSERAEGETHSTLTGTEGGSTRKRVL